MLAGRKHYSQLKLSRGRKTSLQAYAYDLLGNQSHCVDFQVRMPATDQLPISTSLLWLSVYFPEKQMIARIRWLMWAL